MVTDFLQRVSKEIRITLEAFRETVLAVAERVNRKVQTLRLHWQAAALHERLDAVHYDLGDRLCDILSHGRDPAASVAGTNAEMVLLESIGKMRVLKQELVGVETSVRELELETLREDLVALQHDLSTRSAAMQRVMVQSDAAANGRTIASLALPVSVRVAAVLRGPLLMSSVETVELKVGDVVVLLGSRDDLQHALPFFGHTARILPSSRFREVR